MITRKVKKPKKPVSRTRTLYLALEPDLHQRVLDDARMDGRTVSAYVVRIIKKFYSDMPHAIPLTTQM